MTAPAGSLPATYFDAIYSANSDPWGFESSAYEADKYRATLAALGDRHFAAGFEIGCSIGVLTARLAPCCEKLLAVDVSEAALAQARARCASLPQVSFLRMNVPAEFPAQRFDLVLTSEVAYYWSAADLQQAAERIEAALLPGGLWLLVHWTPEVADYPQSGDAVHDAVLARSGGDGALRHISAQRQATYRLDLFERRSAAASGR